LFPFQEGTTGDTHPQPTRNFLNGISRYYLDMIAHYAELPSAPVVYICTICPVYGENPFGISPEVVEDEIVPLVWQIGGESGTPAIDVFTALSGLPEDFPDLVHPNVDGAALIAYTIWQALISDHVLGSGGA
jgi:hypothetical protein